MTGVILLSLSLGVAMLKITCLYRCVAMLVAAVLLPALALPAQAQPLADLAPDDAVLYIGWRGVDNLGAEYDQSNLKALVDASGWRELMDRTVPSLVRRIVRDQRDAAPALHATRQVLGALWHHETMVCFTGVDLDRGRDPQPRIVIVCNAGEDAQPIAETLLALADADDLARAGASITHADGRLVLSTGLAPGVPALHADAATSLARSAHFQRALAKGHDRPVLTIYVNAQAALQIIDRAMLEARDPQAAEMWPKIADAAGITNLKQLLYTGGFDGKQWTDAAFIEAPAPRTGLLALLDSEPLDADALRAIPATVTRFGIGNFDLAKLLAEARGAAAKIDPDAQHEVDLLLRRAQAVVMLDLERGLINALGPRWTWYVDPAGAGASMMNLVVSNRVRDKVKLTQTLNGLANTANMLIASQLREAPVQVRFKQRQVDGVTLTYLATPVVSPTWAVHEQTLYFALHPQSVAAAVAGARDAQRASILDNEAFNTAMDQLQRITGAEAPNSVNYVDVPALAPQGYAGMLIAAQSISGAGELFGVDAPMMLLPRYDQIRPLLSPSASVTWTDDDGWHMQSLSAFPGAELMTIEASMMQIQQLSMLTGVMLPALGQARRTARRVQSNTNARQITLGMVMYSNDHAGIYPPDIATLIEQGYVRAEVLVSPLTDVQVPANIDAWPAEVRSQWIRENCSYIMVAAGLKADGGPDDLIIYGRPSHHDQVIPMAYSVRHAIAIPVHESIREINRQYPDHVVEGVGHGHVQEAQPAPPAPF